MKFEADIVVYKNKIKMSVCSPPPKKTVSATVQQIRVVKYKSFSDNKTMKIECTNLVVKPMMPNIQHKKQAMCLQNYFLSIKYSE